MTALEHLTRLAAAPDRRRLALAGGLLLAGLLAIAVWVYWPAPTDPERTRVHETAMELGQDAEHATKDGERELETVEKKTNAAEAHRRRRKARTHDTETHLRAIDRAPDSELPRLYADALERARRAKHDRDAERAAERQRDADAGRSPGADGDQR